jgi:hypothetical protein
MYAVFPLAHVPPTATTAVTEYTNSVKFSE